MLKNKPGKSVAWLPNQVAYGIDTSDPEPANWRAFGSQADADQVRKAPADSKTASKGHLPEQSGQAAQ